MRLDANITKLIENLKAVGHKVPDVPCVYQLEEPTFGAGTSEEDITVLKSMIKVLLPEDFLLFQKVCGSISAMDVWNGYALLPISQITKLITDPISSRLIQVRNGKPTTIPIGGDGGGDMFLMLLDGSGQVVKWNHEVNAHERIADNFTNFLERILQDWEHFIAQDNDWKYL